jgi:hypothetical protein
MILSPSNYLTVNVAYVPFLPLYRPQLDVSFPPEDDPKFPARCVLSESLSRFDVREFPHHPQERNTTIWNGSASRNPVDLNQASVEGRQLVRLYVSIDQETFDSGICRHAGWRSIMHEVQFPTNDQWHVSQEVRRVAFQESFVMPHCKPILK